MMRQLIRALNNNYKSKSAAKQPVQTLHTTSPQLKFKNMRILELVLLMNNLKIK